MIAKNESMSFDIYATRYCPFCGCDSDVIDSRTGKKGDIWRRRKCVKCGAKWSTKEVIVKIDILKGCDQQHESKR